MTTVQRVFNRHQQPFYVGQITRPYAPHALDPGSLHVPTMGTNVKPGYPVYYDTTNHQFALPTTAATELTIIGVAGFDSGITAGSVTPPTGANSPGSIEFEDDDFIKVVRFGHVAVQVGAACEYGQRLSWDTSNTEWAVVDPDVFSLGTLRSRTTAIDFDTIGDIADNVDTLLGRLQTTMNQILRMPIVVSSPGEHAADAIVEVAVGYGAGII